MKAHIFQSSEPIREGAELIALCGVTLRDSVFVYSWDGDVCPEFAAGLSTLSTCRSCFRAMLSKRYIYGVLSREHVDEARRRAKLYVEDTVA